MLNFNFSPFCCRRSLVRSFGLLPLVNTAHELALVLWSALFFLIHCGDDCQRNAATTIHTRQMLKRFEIVANTSNLSFSLFAYGRNLFGDYTSHFIAGELKNWALSVFALCSKGEFVQISSTVNQRFRITQSLKTEQSKMCSHIWWGAFDWFHNVISSTSNIHVLQYNI